MQPLYQSGRYHSVPKLTIRTDFITLELAVSVRNFNTDRWGPETRTGDDANTRRLCLPPQR